MRILKVKQDKADLYEGIHPKLRRHYVPRPGPEMAQCSACRRKYPATELAADQLCSECDRIVKDLERGKI